MVTCGSTRVFGGYNVFGSQAIVKRRFDNLVNHNRIRISGKYYIFDTWENE